MISKLQLVILLFLSNILNAQKIIIVFGPSCSGKSSFSERLARNLGQGWNVIDRDILIENNGLNAYDLSAFADYINIQIQSFSLVIDTNFYTEDFFNLIKADQKLRILAYASLSKLLERDEFRTQRLNCPPDRARNAKCFVINNYNYYFSADRHYNIGMIENVNTIYTPYQFDCMVNSVSFESSETVIETIKRLLSK